jgi:organic radical activating enzyme
LITKPCLAPFNSIFQNYNGTTSVCCHKPVEIRDKTLHESMHDEKLQAIRKSFVEGKTPPECRECPTQMREYHTENISKELPRIILHEDEHKPVAVDFFWSNKCNFACLGCDSYKSSTIDKNFREIYQYLDNQRQVPKIKYDKQERFDYILKNSDSIKILHLSSSGEPWMEDNVYELLELLLKHKLFDIKIATHTNGSILNYHNKSMIDILEKWGNNATVIMSNDGTGKRGEYVRYGYKDKMWLRTYNKLKETNINVYVHYCLNLFNIMYLKEDADWFKKNCAGTDILLRYWEYPTLLTSKFLEYWNDLYDESIEIFNNSKSYYKDPEYAENYINNVEKVEQLHPRRPVGESFKDDYLRFSSFIRKIDEKRNTDFVKTFPKLNDMVLW